ncbi:MAG: alpha/beta fold hydrolase [Candidatus Neomarinimicrobiota bacterium]
MIGIWIGVIAGLVLLVVVALTRVYHNPQVPHQTTPDQFDIDFEVVRFPTRNNCSLYGWWIPDVDTTESLPTLILVHGFSRNVERMLPYIRNLHGQGFHLLAFDARHHGSSDPDKFSSMLKFAEDIRAAVDFVEHRAGVDPRRIGVLGLSIGGAGTIYAAAHDERIRAGVTVGAFAHPEAVMRLEFRKRRFPYIPFVWLLFRFMEYRIGARFDDIAPINNIRQVKAALLLVHGQDDQTVPVEQGEHLYATAIPDRTELWLQPGRGHSDCHLEPDFWERLDCFFNNAWIK